MLRPGDACQKRFSWFSDWNPEVQMRVNLIDLVKSFHVPSFLNLFFKIDPIQTNTSVSHCLLANFGFDTAENEP